jgi:tRNA threonylcarbamoyladenosine biosynthesis protein TsaB
MSLLLSIETSTSLCSVALHDESKLLYSVENHIPQSASSQLVVMIQQCLTHVNAKANQLNGVIVAAGPGSYTGLRIGVATAKGICYALNVPLLSVNTLELLAYQFQASQKKTEGLLCPMLDARRMEVYCMLLDSSLTIIEPTHAKIIDAASFEETLNKKEIYFFGNGADKCREAIQHKNAHFISGIEPLAAKLGELGHKKFIQSQFEDTATYEPFYLKDFLIRKPNAV